MLMYTYNILSRCTLNIERLESILLYHLQVYCSNSSTQYDTEEFNNYKKISQIIMSFIAINYPTFLNTFFQGETKIFMNRLEKLNCLGVKKELCSLVKDFKYLSQREEFKAFRNKEVNSLQLFLRVAESIIENCDHAFSNSHSKECEDLKIIVPFTFPLELVREREVKILGGNAIIYCGLWEKIVKLIYENFLLFEMKLLKTCKALRAIIYDFEDDRIRQIIKRLKNVLSGSLNTEMRALIKAPEIDFMSQYFPPCMANLHQILKQTHRLSYESRYQYTLFLKDIGVPPNENIKFWKYEYSQPYKGSNCTHEWEHNQNRYKYQIEHIYGLMGKNKFKTSHSCEKFVNKLSSKMNGGCPFQHFTEENLRKSIPKKIMELPDIEDMFKYANSNMPQKACAVYLLCQKKICCKSRISYSHFKFETNYIISPLQYYNAAKAVFKI